MRKTRGRPVEFGPRKERGRPSASRFNKITVGDAAEKVLRRRGAPMRLTEIVTAVEGKGLYRTSSVHLRSTVATALKREKRFEKVRHGLYRWVGDKARRSWRVR